MTISLVGSYMETLQTVVARASVTDRIGARVALDDAVAIMGRKMREAGEQGNRTFFVGNGGSAAICSHMAIDYSKNGGIRAAALNDGAVLTCLGNDYGYEHVFDKQIEWHARPGDILVAISSSGRSANILNAVGAARRQDCGVYTFSGFDGDNPLRASGDLNLHLASHEYGFVEVGHLALLHGILDVQMGWQPEHVRGAA